MEYLGKPICYFLASRLGPIAVSIRYSRTFGLDVAPLQLRNGTLIEREIVCVASKTNNMSWIGIVVYLISN